MLLRQITELCPAVTARLRGAAHEVMRDIVDQVRVHDGRVEIDVSTAAIARLLGVEGPLASAEPITFSASLRLTRTGRAIRLLQNDGALAREGEPDLALVQLVAKARTWWNVLAEGEMDMTALAKREGCQDAYITRVVRVAFLSPAVIEAILAGRQRGGLSATQLRSTSAIPADWRQQASRFLPRSR